MSQARDGAQRQTVQGDIAIIGMDCMFPGAPDLDTYWHNILSKVDAITDPPPEAWDSDVYYDPDSTANDRIYCKRGGFLGPLAFFNPLEHGIPPVAVGGEPDQWLALKVARGALADAGYPDGPEDGRRTVVVLGKGTYLNHGNLSMVQHGLVVDQTIRIIRTLHPEYGEDDLQAIREELKRDLPSITAETVPGLIPNIIAGRIANRLDFMGPSFTVDAACASSLIALDMAVGDLLGGRSDLAIVGGSQVSTPVPIAGVFCQLNALSRRQEIRPFDKDADGTILGEGIGMIVLKRLEDAERDGDRIYALIKGVGTSSDGRGVSVMAPRVEGEELALQRAYERAGVSPRTVGLIEAHGTATPVGDAAEIEALTRVFAGHRTDRDALPWCGVGAVKSMIGHTMPASGIAGLIKVALALYHKVLPPTLNCDEPNPKLELEKTPFYINTETRPWIHGSRQEPRRAGVNSFGFGGINAHVVLEERPDPSEATAPSHQPLWDTEVFVLEGSSREALVRRAGQIDQFLGVAPDVCLKDLAYTLNAGLSREPYRLSLVASSVPELRQKLARALERLSDTGCHQIKDRSGIYFFEQPVSGQGKLAFLFPGEGAQYPNMLSDLCLHFPEIRACFDQFDGLFVDQPRTHLPSDFIFPRPALSDSQREDAEQKLWQIRGAVEAVLASNHALFTLLSRLGVRADAMLGHSTGEYSAMRASGILDLDDEAALSQFALDMNRIHEREAAQNGIPRATLIAVGAGRDVVASIVDQVGGDIYVAMDNCPHQTVVVGDESAAARAAQEMRRRGLICETLPFDRAYHTPLFESYLTGLRELFDQFPISPPSIEVWSCTTMAPYPRDVAKIRGLAVDHWARPVEFRRTVEAMYEAGVRVFVEVGPRGNLVTFVDDILRGRPYLAVPADIQRRSGIEQLNHLVGLLAAQGVEMQLDYLYARRSPQRLSLDQPAESGDSKDGAGAVVKLATGWPPMNISAELVGRLRSRTDGQPPSVAPPRAAPEARPEEGAPEAPAPRPAGPSQDSTVQGVRSPQPASPSPDGAVSQAMLAYMENMERFLETQQQVMQAFLQAAGGSAPVDAAALPRTAAPGPTADGEGPEAPAAAQPVAPPEARSEAPASETPAPEATAADHSPDSIKEALLSLVSDRTGYPVEMLDLDMDMEADLGIDSIKRVEILGAFRAKYGLLEDERTESAMESIGDLKTLQQTLDLLVTLVGDTEAPVRPPADQGPEEPPSHTQDGVSGPQDQSRQFPLIGEVTALTPGRELTARRELRWEEDLFLHDHTLGRNGSVTDSAPRPLPVMPLTLSMEMLAEAAALLVPDRLLVGMRDVRAHRWIKLEGDSVTLEIVARVRPDSQDEVHVEVREPSEGEGRDQPSATPLIEGTMVFSDAYPAPAPVREVKLRGARPSKWTPDRMYTEAMFHGPRWQGATSVDQWGEDGATATLRVLPTDRFFRSESSPQFLTDPVVLDAAGQLVGFWTMEHLESGFVVFPFHLEELTIYGPNLPVDSEVRCQAQIRLVGKSQVSTDFDILRPDGSLWMRLTGWEDKRFHLPSHLYRFLLSPRDGSISSPWPLPTSFFSNCGPLQCFRADGLFESDSAFWMSVFAPLILSPAEAETLRDLRGPPARQSQWLMGRVAAKDAVRAVLRKECGLELCPAEIEIGHDESGRPVPEGPWTSTIETVPALSLVHTNGLAVAVATGAESGRMVGVDAEIVRSQPDGFEEQAFTPGERALLDSLPESVREEWVMRLWCAKEAVGKGLGRGLIQGPKSVAALKIDPETGAVWAGLHGELNTEFPQFAGAGIKVYTARDGDYVVATTLCEEEPGA